MSQGKNVTALGAVVQVERTLDKMPWPGETVATETDRVASPSQAIPRSYILQYLNNEVASVVARVKFMHLPSLWPAASSQWTGTNGTFAGEITRPMAWGVYRGSYRAVFRSPTRLHRLEASGMAAEAAKPVYTFMHGDYQVLPATGTVTLRFVPVPTPVAFVDLSTATLPIPRRLKHAVIWGTVAECWKRLGRNDLAQIYTVKKEQTLAPYLVETQTVPYRRDTEVVNV